MPRTTCTTTFSPTYEGLKLSELVVDGKHQEADVDNDTDFSKGWSLGFGSPKTKTEFQQYLSLEFVDRKVAFHGLHMSGPLTIWIPWGGHLLTFGNAQHIVHKPEHKIHRKMAEINGGEKPHVDNEIRATRWIESLIVCQYRDSFERPDCDLSSDMSFVLGGAAATNIHMIQAVGTHWKNMPLCAQVEVPSSAKMTTHQLTGLMHHELQPNDMGLTVQMTVKNDGSGEVRSPCSISHILWQDATTPLSGADTKKQTEYSA